MVADFDVIDFLHLLTDRSVRLLSASATGVVLADSRGQLPRRQARRILTPDRPDRRLLRPRQRGRRCADRPHRGSRQVTRARRWPMAGP
jgi:hypothetical protein